MQNLFRLLIISILVLCTRTAAQSATATVAWDPSVSPVVGYRCYIATNNSTTFNLAGTVSAATLTFTYTGLANGQTNRMYVKSYVNDPVTGVVESLPSNTITNYIPLAAPQPPSNLRATAVTASSIRLEWQLNGSPEWVVIRRQKGSAGTFEELPPISGQSTAFTDSYLKPRTTYGYEVAAISGSLTSLWSNEDFEKTLRH